MSFPLIAPPMTPMHRDGSIHPEQVRSQAAYFKKTGVSKVFVGGSTGESHSLTVEERMRMLEAWVEAGAETGLGVIVHVGHNCATDAGRMAAHARELGVEAYSISAPCLFKPATVTELIDYCLPIIREAGDLPFYYYHIPALTGVNLPMVPFLKEAKQRIPTLTGIKYTCTTMAEFLDCAYFDDGAYEMLFGYDEGFLSGYVSGASGAIGSTYNFAAAIYNRIIAATDAGDLDTARDEQYKSVQTVNVLAARGYLPSAKAVMGMLGVDCGPVRPPYRNLTDAERSALQEELETSGLLDAWKVSS